MNDQEKLDRHETGEPRPDFHYMKSRIHLRAGEHAEALTELVRAMLVSDEVAFLVANYPPRPPLARTVPSLPRWARLALEALGARLDGDVVLERRRLLEALHEAQEERSLYLAVARLERGQGSDLEVFALENALLGSDWREGHLRLARAYREREELGAARGTLRRLLSHDPDCFDALKALSELGRVIAERRDARRR